MAFCCARSQSNQPYLLAGVCHFLQLPVVPFKVSLIYFIMSLFKIILCIQCLCFGSQNAHRSVAFPEELTTTIIEKNGELMERIVRAESKMTYICELEYDSECNVAPRLLGVYSVSPLLIGYRSPHINLTSLGPSCGFSLFCSHRWSKKPTPEWDICAIHTTSACERWVSWAAHWYQSLIIPQE